MRGLEDLGAGAAGVVEGAAVEVASIVAKGGEKMEGGGVVEKSDLGEESPEGCLGVAETSVKIVVVVEAVGRVDSVEAST